MKTTQNQLSEQIERLKTRRMQVKLQLEQEGLNQDTINLQKSKVTTAVVTEGLRTEQNKLAIGKVNNQTGQIALGKANDKLRYEQTDRILTQQEMAGKLQLKSINVAALREEIRHAQVLNGSNVPQRSFSSSN